MNEKDVKKFLTDAVNKVRVKALNVLVIEGPKIIKKNFTEGGRPVKWKPRKTITKKQKGTNLMVVSGNLSNVMAVKNESDFSVTLITNPSARAYARIHQEGGTINHPAKPLKFRRKKYKSGITRTVFASSKHKKIIKETMSKAYVQKIEARPYMVIPQEELNRVIKLITK
jgi:phage gpG-like protein